MSHSGVLIQLGWSNSRTPLLPHKWRTSKITSLAKDSVDMWSNNIWEFHIVHWLSDMYCKCNLIPKHVPPSPSLLRSHCMTCSEELRMEVEHDLRERLT